MDKRKKRKAVLVSLVIIAVIWQVVGYPAIYFAKSSSGMIVDAETGKPIEGAVVVAQWVLYQAGPGHGGHGPRLKVLETVTDEDGRYQISGWGPRLRFPLTRLTDRDPMISIFRAKYSPRVLFNKYSKNNMIRFSEWDEKTIKINRPNKNPERAAFRLSTFVTGFNVDQWYQIPLMSRELYAEVERLRSLGIRPGYAPSIPKDKH